MRWAVKIEQTSLSERNLADILETLGFKREEIADCPVLAGDAFDACDGVVAAFELAKKVSQALSGASQVDPNFRLGAVFDLSRRPPSCCHLLEARGTVSPSEQGQARLTVGPPAGLTSHAEAAWQVAQAEAQYQQHLHNQSVRAKACFRSAKVEKALVLLAESALTGEILYKVYELAEGHPKRRREFHKQMNISQSEFNRFKDAIHNPTVTGDWARHAYEDQPRTDRPMSRRDAERFVRAIVQQWIEALAQESKN